MEICIKDIREAYEKLKAFIYHDSFNLNLRIKLAEYEDENKLERNFDKLLQKINSGNIDEYLEQISTYILPKRIASQQKNDTIDFNIVRNDISALSQVNYLDSDDYNFYFNAPIEIYIIDVLWIMKEGCYLITENIQEDCYGNTLVYQVGKSKQIKKGVYLFDRYFDKYQEWRDKGIKRAKDEIKNNNDVLLICLDIKRFYPNSQIDFEKISNALLLNSVEPLITSLLEKIYNKYHTILNLYNDNSQQYPQLPIGLLSSGVIANWYLSDFDVVIKERFNPIYYGRYVDDIFMVISNVKPKAKDWFKKNFLSLKDSPFTKEKGIKDEYYLRTHKNLKINKDKIKLFYFSPNHPLAILENFQKTLDENSSAFWLLPDGDNLIDTLNSKGFNIIYEDSINKFREISGVKNNKYGASVFLAKQIRREIVCRDSNKSNTRSELFKYFTGVRLIEMYSLWEKVFTYFVVVNDKKSLKKFESNICEEIQKIEIINNKKLTEILKASLLCHCEYCKDMALALNMSMIDNDSPTQIHLALKKSYLIRQHYMPYPALLYTNTENIDLISHNAYKKLYEYNNLIINGFNPRRIHAYEICLCKLFNYVSNFNNKNTFDFQELFSSLKSFGLYNDELEFNDKYIKLSNNDSIIVEIPQIKCKSETGKKKGQLKVGISNIKIDENDINLSIKGSSTFNMSKRQRHYHLLNLSTIEQVDCLVLPEVSIPIELLVTYAEHSRRKQQLIIAGLEHIVYNNFCFNFSVIFLPYVHNGNKEVLLIPRIKNHYSPEEKKEILKNRKYVPTVLPSIYHIVNWRDIQFSVFNCYELADIFHRSLFRSKIDVLFAIENNKDTYYYSNIVESACRELHCYFVQANTSNYGDSRLSVPKKYVDMTPVKIKGGENDTIITFTLDIKSLREFQLQETLLQNNDTFKKLPPGFSYKDVEDRCK